MHRSPRLGIVRDSPSRRSPLQADTTISNTYEYNRRSPADFWREFPTNLDWLTEPRIGRYLKVWADLLFSPIRSNTHQQVLVRSPEVSHRDIKFNRAQIALLVCRFKNTSPTKT